MSGQESLRLFDVSTLPWDPSWTPPARREALAASAEFHENYKRDEIMRNPSMLQELGQMAIRGPGIRVEQPV